MTATEHKVWQFMRTISHPATGFRVYDIYEHATDPRRYAHVYNGPMVGRPRACIYLVDAGIGQMTDETTVETFMEGVTR